MALSEQEQRLLDELEASLAADDPTLARALRGEQEREHEPLPGRDRHAGVLVLGFVAGLAALLGGTQVHPLVSVLGFVAMLAAAVALSDQLRRRERQPGRDARALARATNHPSQYFHGQDPRRAGGCPRQDEGL